MFLVIYFTLYISLTALGYNGTLLNIHLNMFSAKFRRLSMTLLNILNKMTSFNIIAHRYLTICHQIAGVHLQFINLDIDPRNTQVHAVSFSQTISPNEYSQIYLKRYDHTKQGLTILIMTRMPIHYSRTICSQGSVCFALIRRALFFTWCRQMEAFAVLLALPAGNSTVTEFPSKRASNDDFDLIWCGTA